MNILVPALPKRLVVTPTMVDDFLCNPVLAAKFFLGLEFDIFQRVRLKLFWWVPYGIDSSGFTSGKTICDWAYIQLRCLLLPEHAAGVYYPVFETGKKTFWTYYTACKSPIFQAHLGRLDERGEEDGTAKSRGSSCYTAFFRNGSQVLMPAPSMQKEGLTQASLRFNTMLFEEWTHIESMGDAINKQLMQRNTKPCFFNQHHPLWSNHMKFTAPAKKQLHPAFARVAQVERQIHGGNPHFFHIHFCYKDYSDLRGADGRSYKESCRLEGAIAAAKAMHDPEEWLGEGFGLWVRSGTGWYAEADLLRCVEAGAARGVRPVASRAEDEATCPAPERGRETVYFNGTDPAPSQSARNDDGATVVLRARLRPGAEGFSDNPADWELAYVYARRLRNADAAQWSGMLHGLHRRFSFARMLLDWGAGGGGPYIAKELAKTRQVIDGAEAEVTPLVQPHDAVVRGDFLLHVFKRKDPGIARLWGEMSGDDVLADRAHTEMRQALMGGQPLWPKRYPEWTAAERSGLGEENLWSLKCLTGALDQFGGIVVETEDGPREAGGARYALTRNGARKFHAARGRHKDFQTACMLAYIAFLIWLRSEDGRLQRAEGDAAGFSGF